MCRRQIVLYKVRLPVVLLKIESGRPIYLGGFRAETSYPAYVSKY